MKKHPPFALALLCLSVIENTAYSQTATADWTHKVQLGLRDGFSVSNLNAEMEKDDIT